MSEQELKDIQQQIEKEAKRLANIHFREHRFEKVSIPENEIHNAIADKAMLCANFILSQWQEAERWREVSEELPEYSMRLLVKFKEIGINGNLWSIANYNHLENKWFVEDKFYRQFEITHWKPIQ